ncbi:MAG: hypothetical protein ABIS18_05820 [Actinomycetota bacterium]
MILGSVALLDEVRAAEKKCKSSWTLRSDGSPVLPERQVTTPVEGNDDELWFGGSLGFDYVRTRESDGGRVCWATLSNFLIARNEEQQD